MDKKKRSVSEKRDRMLGFVTAMPAMILLFVFTVLFLPRRKSRSREKNGGDCKLCESAVFHYTHYNESSESKSLLRAIESARQMSKNIKMETENGGQLREDFLKEKRCRRDKNMGWSGSC